MKNLRMSKKIFIIIFGIITLQSCVETGFQDQNIVVQHVSSLGDGLHPLNDNSVTRSFIFQYTQKTLIKLDIKSLKYIPVLVTELPTKENGRISEDDLRYTYHLKEGIFWDDGIQLTAKDVEFSTKMMLCPFTDNTQIRSNYSTVIYSIELDPEDPLKFTMVAKGINYTNKDIFSELYILQKSHWDPDGIVDEITFDEMHNEVEETNDRYNFFFNFNHVSNGLSEKKLVGLGPYEILEDDYQDKQYIILTKKRDWWGEKDISIYNQSFPERIIFKVINNPTSIAMELISQDIDVLTSINTKVFLDLRNNDIFNNNYVSAFLPQFSYAYLGLNQKPDGIEYKKFFVDKKVRRAIAYTVPVDELIEIILHGKANRQAAQISHLKKTYNDTLKLIPLDIEKAKKLLTEAGWTDTDGDNIRDKIVDGEKLQFSFKLSYMSSPTSKVIAHLIKESMYKAGINAIPTPMDFTLFYNNAQEHNFDAMLGGWGGSASYSNPMQLWHTTSWFTKGSNFCGFGDAESDALIEEANTSLDFEKHKAALWKLQSKIYNEQPYVFLYSTKNKIAIHNKFDNRNMYTERPGVILNNLKLNHKNLSPTNGE